MTHGQTGRQAGTHTNIHTTRHPPTQTFNKLLNVTFDATPPPPPHTHGNVNDASCPALDRRITRNCTAAYPLSRFYYYGCFAHAQRMIPLVCIQKAFVFSFTFLDTICNFKHNTGNRAAARAAKRTKDKQAQDV